jgi:acyl carrier protein
MTVDELFQPILNTTEPLKLTDTRQTIPAWDSLAQMTIIAAIEDLIGTDLSIAEVLSIKSVAQVVEVCRSHGVELSLQ